MLPNNKQEFKKKFFSSQTFLFILLLALIWVSLACIKITHKKYQMIKEIEGFKAQSIKLKDDIGKLESRKELLKNSDYLEKEAKLRLGLKKEGEEVVVLPKNINSANIQLNQASPSDQLASTSQAVIENGTTSSVSTSDENETNLHKWWRYFFH